MLMHDALYVARWVTQHAAEVTYVTGSDTTETWAGSGDKPRFVRVQAHTGDLLVQVGSNLTAPPGTVSTGDLRVYNGTYQVFQCFDDGGNPSLKIRSVAASATGSVVWGI